MVFWDLQMKKSRWRDVRRGRTVKVTDEESVLKKTLNVAVSVSYFTRLKALIIDLFMLYTPILYVMTYFVIGSATEFRESDLGVFIAWNLYGITSAVLIAVAGQTPGMRAMGLWLTNSNGERLGFFMAFGRFLLFILSACLFFGIAIPSIRREKTTLHDWILGTIMVEDDTRKSLD